MLRATDSAALAADPGESIPRLAQEVESRRTSTGALHLRGPEFKRRHLHRLFAWLLRLPKHVEVELDDLGAFVVERMDGRPLRQLAADLAAHLKLSRREAEVALADFMRLLLQRRLIRLDHADSAQASA